MVLLVVMVVVVVVVVVVDVEAVVVPVVVVVVVILENEYCFLFAQFNDGNQRFIFLYVFKPVMIDCEVLKPSPLSVVR